MRHKQHVPFDGAPPDVADGDDVEVRDTAGRWHRRIAAGPPRYDDVNSFGWNTFLTVPIRVTDPAEWRRRNRTSQDWINWPAEDVRPVHAEQEN